MTTHPVVILPFQVMGGWVSYNAMLTTIYQILQNMLAAVDLVKHCFLIIVSIKHYVTF